MTVRSIQRSDLRLHLPPVVCFCYRPPDSSDAAVLDEYHSLTFRPRGSPSSAECPICNLNFLSSDGNGGDILHHQIRPDQGAAI